MRSIFDKDEEPTEAINYDEIVDCTKDAESPYTGVTRKKDKLIDFSKPDGMARDQRRFRSSTPLMALGGKCNSKPRRS